MTQENANNIDWPSMLPQLKNIDQKRLALGLLVISGISQKELAIKYKVDQTILSKVLNGTRKSSRVRALIAQELNVHVDKLWPEEEVRRKRREMKAKRRHYFDADNISGDEISETIGPEKKAAWAL